MSVGPVIVVLIFGVACFLLIGGTLVSSLRHSNRVGVRGKCIAPLRWLFDPSGSARLHRRLRRVVTSIRPWLPKRSRRHDELSPIAAMARDIEIHAVALDYDIVTASRAPSAHRRPLLSEIATQVAGLEALSTRVVTLGSAQHQLSEPTPDAIDRMNAQLDALEEAHDEIARLEAQLGLDTRSRPSTDTDLA
jgi:hypothetical protein